MSDFAIGDIQGCYEPLMRLLDLIQFDEKNDRLWFVGDLVNRGPDSLKVLRFIYQLPVKPIVTLGNHDLHLLSAIFGGGSLKGDDDTLEQVLKAEDCEELGHWLRRQHILFHSETLNLVMTHAGIPPFWNLAQAKRLAGELESYLQGDNFHEFLMHMYGNEPHLWDESLTGFNRLRMITNAFTRMRFCDREGGLVLQYKGSLKQVPSDLFPWFAVPGRVDLEEDLVFGHWAALRGQSPLSHIYAIDTGCIWGGELTALRLQDKVRLAVPGLVNAKKIHDNNE